MPSPAASAIETRGLTKVFPPKRRGIFDWLRRKPKLPARTALSGVDLTVQKGELFGLLGPNGAGKTTLVKILSTLLLPTEGEAMLAGMSVRDDAVTNEIRRKVGVVLGGDRALYWRLTARENLWYFSQLYDMPKDEAKAAIERVLGQVDLLDRGDDRIENYSKGMKQRLHIARGLLMDPEILLLDEPTIGLDPHAARSLRALVRKLVDEYGRTVVLTTHYMYEADELSDRIGILHNGRIIALGTSDELKAKHSQKSALVVRTRGPAELGVPVSATDPATGISTYRLPGDFDPAKASELVTKSKATLVSLQLQEPTLEDVFVALTGEGLNAHGERSKPGAPAAEDDD